MKRFEFGGLRIEMGVEEEPTKNEILNEGEGFQIVKREIEGEAHKTFYVYTSNDEDIVSIRGIKEEEVFHISRIENETEDGVSGKFLPQVFRVMEDDLRKQGVTKLTTDALVRLGPILIKRYGFREESGKTDDDIRRLADRNKYGKAIGLEKDI